MGVPVEISLNYFNLTTMEINQSDRKGWTMLHHAVHENHLECVRQLLQNPGVQTRSETFERETPLFLGCARKDIQFEIIELLLKRDPLSYQHRNDANKSVLDLMVRNGRVDLVDLLRSAAEPYSFIGKCHKIS
jgi:ankyrin repeat protein